jgi:hypothetical protein
MLQGDKEKALKHDLEARRLIQQARSTPPGRSSSMLR